MIRVRSLASTCARECVRSAAASANARTAVRGGGGSRVAVAVRVFSESSFTAAEPQPPSAASSSSQGHPEDLAAIQPETEQIEEEQAETLGDLLRQHTWERKDWMRPLEMSDDERTRLTRELVHRLQGLSRANKHTKARVAIRILDHGRERGIKDLSVYRAVLKQLLSIFRVSDDGPKSLEMVLQRMKEDRLRPDVKTYNHILDFHAQSHNEEDAVATSEEMMSMGLKPDAKTLSHLIVAHSRGCHKAMYRVVGMLYFREWQASRAAYLGMIAVMGKHQDHEGVLKTINSMWKESKRPTEAAFFWAFRAADSLGQVETAKQLFQHRTDVGLPPQQYVYVKMMVMLMKDGKPDECLEYWRQLVCVHGLNGVDISRETYNFAIKCTMAVGNLEEMEAVVDMMEMQGVAPTPETYVAALNSLEGGAADSVQGMKGVERAFKAIAAIGPPPTTELLRRKAVLYAHAKMWQESVDLFSTVLADGAKLSPRDWKCLMMSQFELSMFEQVKETWTLRSQMRSTGLSYIALEYALRAAHALNDPDWALELRAAAKEHGKLSTHVDSVVARVLLESGRLEAARDVMKEWERLWHRGSPRPELGEVYWLGLRMCEKLHNPEVALDLLESMRSANPSYRPSSTCTGFLFALQALEDAGRGEEMSNFEHFGATLTPREDGASPESCSAVIGTRDQPGEPEEISLSQAEAEEEEEEEETEGVSECGREECNATDGDNGDHGDDGGQPIGQA